jgi:energy-converting hydrogenase Eha subunit F
MDAGAVFAICFIFIVVISIVVILRWFRPQKQTTLEQLEPRPAYQNQTLSTNEFEASKTPRELAIFV